MKVLVDCRSLHLSKAKGLENFALSVVEGISAFVEEIILDVRKPDLQFCKNYFIQYTNITFVYDPIQYFCTPFLYRDIPFPFKAAKTIFYKARMRLGPNPYMPRDRWARKCRADVVLYPSHRYDPQHKQIPMVTTVHAILPEYGPKDMAIIREHARSAKAIVTSWPYPFKDLLNRYPFLKAKMFLVPFTVVRNTVRSEYYDILKLGVKEPFYFYPAVIKPRKNHINLIKAYGLIKKQGWGPPLIVCTGGNSEHSVQELISFAKSLGVSDRFLFLGHIPETAMAALYNKCRAALSASLEEAGMAAIQEGGICGKPIICSDIPAAREHARLFDMDVCFFDPNDPEDMAKKILEFEKHIEFYRRSSLRARDVIKLIDLSYTGKCYSDILRYAAGQAPKPEWAPFMTP